MTQATAHILEELDMLPLADLMLVRRRILEIEHQDDDVAMCDAAAIEGAQMLDRMEAEDAKS